MNPLAVLRQLVESRAGYQPGRVLNSYSPTSHASGILDFPPVAGHSGYAAIVDGDGLRVV
jgi:hypothetical protein